MKKILNWIFQYSWSAVKGLATKPLVMEDYAANPRAFCEQWAKNIIAQIKWADTLGIKVDLLFVGDSNVEFARKASVMVGWGGLVVVNGGKAGSRFDHQVGMWKSESGQKLLDLIKEQGIGIFENCGGNHVLQNSMENMESSAKECLSLIEGSAKFIAAQDLPAINTPVLAPAYGTDNVPMMESVAEANEIIRRTFFFTVQFGRMLTDADIKDPVNMPGLTLAAAAGELGDGLVHYSDGFNRKIRLPFLAKYVSTVAAGDPF